MAAETSAGCRLPGAWSAKIFQAVQDLAKEFGDQNTRGELQVEGGAAVVAALLKKRYTLRSKKGVKRQISSGVGRQIAQHAAEDADRGQQRHRHLLAAAGLNMAGSEIRTPDSQPVT